LTVPRSKIVVDAAPTTELEDVSGDVVDPSLDDIDSRVLLAFGPALNAEPDLSTTLGEARPIASISGPSRGSVRYVGQASTAPNHVPPQRAEASSTSKPRRTRKRKADQQEADDEDDATNSTEVDVDRARLNQMILTYLVQTTGTLPMARRSSPVSKRRSAPTSHRDLDRRTDTTPAVRNLFRTLTSLTRQQPNGDKFADADFEDEEEGYTCDQCPKRVKRLCDMK
jgi:hypothetical protein